MRLAWVEAHAVLRNFEAKPLVRVPESEESDICVRMLVNAG